VVNLLNSMRLEPGISKEDKLLAVTTLSFDISVLELFLPLTVGACVELAAETLTDPGNLAEQIDWEDITLMQATPSLWQSLIDNNWQGKSDLRVLCGGEALPRRLASDLVSRAEAVWNMYGPTETTVWSSIFKVSPEHEGQVPIGRPIAGTQFHLLDQNLDEVAPDVVARLYIGGEGLARGYRGRPDLTGERFIPDPFSSVPGARVYHTGDVACLRADGVVEYLGREDFQAKVRGFRIEPGEIEAALEIHPGIRKEVIVVREDVPGDKRIVAYYTAVSGEWLTPSELRHHLAVSLPGFMMPSRYVRVEEFPLMPSGKIDRGALPAPTMTRARCGELVPPKTDFEKEVAEIWSGLLGFDEIGLNDYFFEMGGHSLLMMQTISRVREAFGVRLSISEVLTKGATVSGMVVLIENALFENVQYGDFIAALQELENMAEGQAKSTV
jgi:acyl-CoA synthetase (AMP-forming)/AMP-acid ligase II